MCGTSRRVRVSRASHVVTVQPGQAWCGRRRAAPRYFHCTTSECLSLQLNSPFTLNGTRSGARRLRPARARARRSSARAARAASRGRSSRTAPEDVTSTQCCTAPGGTPTTPWPACCGQRGRAPSPAGWRARATGTCVQCGCAGPQAQPRARACVGLTCSSDMLVWRLLSAHRLGHTSHCSGPLVTLGATRSILFHLLN